jgi:hypothetical protein
VSLGEERREGRKGMSEEEVMDCRLLKNEMDGGFN